MSAREKIVLVQLSDPHLRVDEPQRAAQFAAAIQRVVELEPQPVAVLVTGDIADHGVREAYESARDLLAAITVPVHVIPGNHDDRTTMREVLGSPGAGDEQIRFAIEAGPVRVIACDTILPGKVEGDLDMAWLAERLDDAPDSPTIVALHHPPVDLGTDAMDAYGMPAATQAAFAALMERSPQVLAVVGGHVHRASTAMVGGRPFVSAPSVNFQLSLDLAGDSLEVNDEPPGFLIHVLVDGRLVSHVQPVARL